MTHAGDAHAPVVVGYDGSPAAAAALRFAKAIASPTGDQVLAVTVHPTVPPVFAKGSSAAADADIAAVLRADALDVLQGLGDEEVRKEAVPGSSPAEGLHRVARRLHAQLVAVGVTHRAALGRLLVGGVGDRLLHGASCPVAVVPAGWEGPRLATVGVGFDGRLESWVALRAAHDLAVRMDARLEVIGVYEPAAYLWLTTPDPTPPPWDVDDLQRRFDGYLNDAVAELHASVPVRVRTVSGLPGPALAEAAHGVDLLVTGSRGYGRLGSVLLGSVSRYVADHAPSPLLVVPRATAEDEEPPATGAPGRSDDRPGDAQRHGARVTCAAPTRPCAKVVNPVVVAVLRSPLHAALSRHVLLVEAAGRRTGRLRRTPVNYRWEDGTLVVRTLRRRQWWRNPDTRPRRAAAGRRTRAGRRRRAGSRGRARRGPAHPDDAFRPVAGGARRQARLRICRSPPWATAGCRGPTPAAGLSHVPPPPPPVLSTDAAGAAYRVVVAGGGVAGLETALAVRELAGDRVSVTLLAPDAHFVYRPQAVREPFALGAADRYDLRELAAGLDAELVGGPPVVDRRRGPRRAHRRGPGAALRRAGDRRRRPDAGAPSPGAHDGSGAHRRAAPRPHPGRRKRRRPQPGVRRPVGADLAAAAVRAGADDRATGLRRPDAGGHHPRHVRERAAGRLRPGRERRRAAPARRRRHRGRPDRVGADAVGGADRRHDPRPAAARRPGHGDARAAGPVGARAATGPQGLIPIDAYCRVRGLEDVYAAGDATDYPIKHGGVSAQQGVTAAYGIAARAGAPVLPRSLRPSIRAVLLTGAAPRYLSARVAGDSGILSEISDTPSWSPPEKIAADHLTAFLAEHGRKVSAPAGTPR